MKWPQVRLDNVSRIVSGATPKTDEQSYWGGPIAWVTPKDLSDNEGMFISQTARTLTPEGAASCSTEILPINTVLFSSRAPIGHVAINTTPMCTNQGFKSFIPDALKLDSNYLYFWLRANRAYLDSLGTGATFKELSKATISKVTIPLPPLDEQKRIAAILDAADALRAKRRRALARLDDLARALFLHHFGDPVTNPKGWPVVCIGDLLKSASYGTSEKSSSTGQFAVLRMNNITKTGEMDFRELKFMNLEERLQERYLLRKGDVLFNRTNSPELVGKTGLYKENKPMAYAGYLIRLRLKEEHAPEFLWGFLNSEYSKKMLRGMCKNIIGMANINATEIQAMQIPHPPLALQQRFAEELGKLDALKARHREHLAKLDALFASLQSRAFTGEL